MLLGQILHISSYKHFPEHQAVVSVLPNASFKSLRSFDLKSLCRRLNLRLLGQVQFQNAVGILSLYIVLVDIRNIETPAE